ncbi:MAG TPA: response regulator transcription factor, partial [Saprospiraceae bacterium]|nr:response regulator transcription factor [Saprospiraceae bacterium]
WLTQIESHNQKILEMTVFQKNNEAKLSFTANLTNVRADFIKKTASGIENQRDLKLTSMFNEASMTVNEYAVLIYNITKWMGGTMNLIRNEAERIVEINIPLRINILQSNKTTNHRNISDNYKILIADDHFLTRLSTKKNIKSILGDIMIDEAENGEQAIMKAEKEKYDLILMDIEMPGMDGKESMLEIKKIYNPTIIALVHEDAEAKQELIFEGFAGVLKKPIRTEELTEVINRQSQNLLSYYE